MEIYLSLGSNLGDREQNIIKALELLDEGLGVHYTALSGFLETEPWGFDSDELFLNCAVRYDINGVSGMDLLAVCKRTEILMGRSVHCPEYDGSGKRIYRSRIMDVDILFYGEHRIDTDNLKVPHPLMAYRDFVMIPLAEIASEEIKAAFPDIWAMYAESVSSAYARTSHDCRGNLK